MISYQSLLYSTTVLWGHALRPPSISMLHMLIVLYMITTSFTVFVTIPDIEYPLDDLTCILNSYFGLRTPFESLHPLKKIK